MLYLLKVIRTPLCTLFFLYLFNDTLSEFWFSKIYPFFLYSYICVYGYICLHCWMNVYFYTYKNYLLEPLWYAYIKFENPHSIMNSTLIKYEILMNWILRPQKMYFPFNKGVGKHEVVKNSIFLVCIEPNYKSHSAHKWSPKCPGRRHF